MPRCSGSAFSMRPSPPRPSTNCPPGSTAGAVLILIVLALYVGWVWRRPRVVGREGWCGNLPGGPLTLLQIGIGIVDLGFCALAMYMLVPDEPNIGFVTLAVI